MKILVIEDSVANIASAREAFKDQELVVATSFDEAMEALSVDVDFDVVLTDMNMPMSEFRLAPKAFKAGEQVPYGFVLALRACLVGVKYVAMVTGTNHHHGAMSAALDLICPVANNREDALNKAMTINGSTCMFMHAPLVGFMGSPKDWGMALQWLLKGSYIP